MCTKDIAWLANQMQFVNVLKWDPTYSLIGLSWHVLCGVSSGIWAVLSKSDPSLWCDTYIKICGHSTLTIQSKWRMQGFMGQSDVSFLKQLGLLSMQPLFSHFDLSKKLEACRRTNMPPMVHPLQCRCQGYRVYNSHNTWVAWSYFLEFGTHLL